MKKILLGGLIVLLALFAISCAQDPELNVENHKENSRWEHVWEDSNDDDRYIRSLLKFNIGKLKYDSVAGADTAVIDIKMDYPQNGKAGLAFAFTNRKLYGQTNPTTGKAESYNAYSYYLLGIGANTANTGYEYYIDYIQDMTSVTGGTASDVTSNAQEVKPVQAATNLNENNFVADEPATFRVAISAGENGYTVKIISVTVGNSTHGSDGAPLVTKVINHSDYVTKYTSSEDEETPALTGELYSYGMLSGKNAGTKKVKTTWTIDREASEGVTALSADEN